jgi:hypothetical protein
MDVWIQILYVLSWLILLKFIQISVYPALRSPLGRLAYPVSLSGGILAFLALSWYLGLLRLPVSLAALPFVGLLAWITANVAACGFAGNFPKEFFVSKVVLVAVEAYQMLLGGRPCSD